MQEQVKEMPTAEPHSQLCEFQDSQGCTPQKQIPNFTEKGHFLFKQQWKSLV